MNAIFLSTLPARGATVYRHVGLAVKVLFLSTLPARGATVFQRGCINVKCQFLSTLTARGATDGRTGAVVVLAISIHAPREGSDRIDAPALQLLLISIHAPREGSDQRRQTLPPTAHYFYPRSPRGERPGHLHG